MKKERNFRLMAHGVVRFIYLIIDFVCIVKLARLKNVWANLATILFICSSGKHLEFFRRVEPDAVHETLVSLNLVTEDEPKEKESNKMGFDLRG